MTIRVALVAGALLAGSVQASVLTYDPTLGSLPQAQGWSFAGSFAAPMNVAGGQLTYGPTTTNGTTYWEHAPVAALDFSSQAVFIEATVRLANAGFGNISGFRRGGFSLYLQDGAGRWIIADMGDNAISLGNDNNRTSDPAATFNLTNAFHTIRLEAGPSGSRLLVDGVPQLSLALGGGASGGSLGWWGEGTVLTSAGSTEIRGVTFVPAPGSLTAASLAFAAACRRRRR